ncbi:MAG TPA: hypothetical protein VIN36_06135 [Thiobacillus sp.]
MTSDLRILRTISLVLVLMASTSVSASLFGFGKESWKEEVLLHDGQKLIIERSRTRGGNHELGQESPVAEEKLSFTLPNKHEVITWKTKHDPRPSGLFDPQLVLLAVDIIHGTPFIVTTTTTCSSYNNWDRPNPPYVLFKFVDRVWQRIPLAELPLEITGANVVINPDVSPYRLATHWGVVSADEVKKLNEDREQEDVRYLRLFVRKSINNADTNCSKFE